MSVEAKIRELMEDTTPETLDEAEAATDLQASEIGKAGKKASEQQSKDTSITAKNAGDTTAPMQGSSEKADMEEMDELDAGKKAAASVSKDNTLPQSKGDAKSVEVKHVTEEDQEEIVEEESEQEELNIEEELNSIFGEDLSEEFKAKATSIFEAVVIARVNDEMEKVTASLEEQAATQLNEFKEELVEKVDNFLNYVVEQWMEENELAVESGLRSEIAEEFISGLKNLFVESYIEVPEEKYDVLDDLSEKATSLEAKLDETIAENIELHNAISDMMRDRVFEEVTKDLASTEVEKLKSLVEGVEFDGEEIYKDKIAVIKENYFPSNVTKTSPEQVLVEESGTAPDFNMNETMAQYVQSLSRTIKK